MAWQTQKWLQQYGRCCSILQSHFGTLRFNLFGHLLKHLSGQ
jgi:hypothetical protein